MVSVRYKGPDTIYYRWGGGGGKVDLWGSHGFMGMEWAGRGGSVVTGTVKREGYIKLSAN